MRPRREKNLQPKPTVQRRQTQPLIRLHSPQADRGGKKAEFFRAGGYTKNSNRKFYKKKAESPVSLFTG